MKAPTRGLTKFTHNYLAIPPSRSLEAPAVTPVLFFAERSWVNLLDQSVRRTADGGGCYLPHNTAEGIRNNIEAFRNHIFFNDQRRQEFNDMIALTAGFKNDTTSECFCGHAPCRLGKLVRRQTNK